MKSEAVLDTQYKRKTQPLSGFTLGYEPVKEWKVRIFAGGQWFLSSKTYANEKSAKSAAKRLEDK